MDFEGKIALVTGGASGIGKATVMAFARQGATVICADVNAAAGEALKQDAAAAKLKVDFVAIDHRLIPHSIRAAAAEVLKRYPRLDILVNGAGWGDAQPFMQNYAGIHRPRHRHQPRRPGASDAGAVAGDDRRQWRQDRQYRQRCRPRRQRAARPSTPAPKAA